MSEVVVQDQSIHEETVAHQHPLETIPQGSQSDSVENGHDHSDINTSAVFKFAAGLMVLIAVSLIFSWAVMAGILNSLKAADTVPSATYAERANLEKSWPFPPIEAELQPREEAPDLQPDPEKPLLVLREEENAALHGEKWEGGANWVTNEKGERVAVSIPIEDAMQLTLERGLPTEQKAKVEVRKPTGDVAEMGSIPPSETQMKQRVLQSKGIGGDKKKGVGAQNQSKTRAGMTDH